MMTTLLSILIGFQLVQTVALVVLFRVLVLQRRDRVKRLAVIVNIRESLHGEMIHGKRFPWFLYEPGSIEHPGSVKSLDQYTSAYDAIRAGMRRFPGVRVVVTDGYNDNIDPQAILDHRMIEAGASK